MAFNDILGFKANLARSNIEGMLNRIIILFAVISLLSSPCYSANLKSLERKYQSALVMDLSTGKVLYAHNENKQIIPASLVKMMVGLIAMEEILKRHISLDDEITVTAAASRIGGHQVYLKHGEVFTLEELLKAIVISSANDAAYAVAEYIGKGDVNAFVKMMNKRAKELKLHNTRFANPHGLPPNKRKGQKENYSTAYDLAQLGRYLTRFPMIVKWTSTRLDSFRNGTFQLLNTNHRFLRQVKGANGLKTGYHPRGAGFCLVATASREGKKLLTVVTGAKNSRDRLTASKMLIELGFKGKL